MLRYELVEVLRSIQGIEKNRDRFARVHIGSPHALTVIVHSKTFTIVRIGRSPKIGRHRTFRVCRGGAGGGELRLNETVAACVSRGIDCEWRSACIGMQRLQVRLRAPRN